MSDVSLSRQKEEESKDERESLSEREHINICVVGRFDSD